MSFCNIFKFLRHLVQEKNWAASSGQGGGAEGGIKTALLVGVGGGVTPRSPNTSAHLCLDLLNKFYNDQLSIIWMVDIGPAPSNGAFATDIRQLLSCTRVCP